MTNKWNNTSCLNCCWTIFLCEYLKIMSFHGFKSSMRLCFQPVCKLFFFLSSHIHSFFLSFSCWPSKNSSYRFSWMASRDNWKRLHVTHTLTGTGISSISLKRLTHDNWARLNKMKQKEDRKKYSFEIFFSTYCQCYFSIVQFFTEDHDLETRTCQHIAMYLKKSYC